MIEYNEEDIQIIAEYIRIRGYRYIREGGKYGNWYLHASNKLLAWIKGRKSLCSEDLKDITPTDELAESSKHYMKYEAYRREFTDFRNVMFEVDLLNIPAFISDEDIKEFVKARLEIGK